MIKCRCYFSILLLQIKVLLYYFCCSF